MASHDDKGINTTLLANNLSQINGLTDTNNQEITEITLPKSVKLNNVKYKIKEDGTVIINNSILPDEYQQIEYIESTGTQYIDTGVDNTVGFKADLTIALTSKNTSVPTVIGCSLGEINQRSFFDINEQGYWRIGVGGSVIPSTELAQINQKNNFEVSTISGNEYIKLNDNYISQKAENYSGPSYNIYLFARNNIGTLTASTFATFKLYNCKIYNNLETLRKNFIPCRRKSDNKPGLFDLVDNEFYTNKNNSGEDFVAGPDV